MNKKQKKVLEWMNVLEQYAKENQLSMRIVDSIEECKKSVAIDANWDLINSEVEGLLDSIEQKTVSVIAKADNRENLIPLQEVEAQLKGMAQRCHRENVASADGTADRKKVILKETYEKCVELSHVEAHLEEMQDEGLYLAFFEKVKNDYEKKVYEMLRELVTDIGNHYDHMVDHLKSLFRSIDGNGGELGNEKFYIHNDEQRECIDKKMQNELMTADIGSPELVSLGQRTKKSVKRIVGKSSIKKNILMWLPAAIILCGCLYGIITVAPFIQEAYEMAKEIAAENKDISVIFTFFQEFGKLIDMGVIMIVFVVICLLYAVYIKMIKKWYHKQICRKCGEYLQTELSRFEQSNDLLHKIDETIKNAIEDYEQQYLVMLNNILAGTKYDPDSEKRNTGNQFFAIREGWKALKYE